MKFKDDDQFGDMSFLDILEEYNIPYVYYDDELTFLSRASEVMAQKMWQSLTGSMTIGYAPIARQPEIHP